MKEKFEDRGRSSYRFNCRGRVKHKEMYFFMVTDSLDYAVAFLENDFNVDVLSIDLHLDSKGTIIVPPWDERK